MGVGSISLNDATHLDLTQDHIYDILLYCVIEIRSAQLNKEYIYKDAQLAYTGN